MDVIDFVCYSHSSPEPVLGVKEFQIAQALLEGRAELLSQPVPVPSHWAANPVHLFDLCLTFGHFDTAWAMAERGVKGCRLEAHHLKRDCYDQVIDERPPFCKCRNSWETCQECCFGFPAEQGIWMTDWNAHLPTAAAAAHRTAEQFSVRTVLEALRSNLLPQSLAISEEAMAHLLDIAILIGDREAAVRCAEQSRLRPLRRRRWRKLYGRTLELPDRGMLLAALSAGVELQGLQGSTKIEHVIPRIPFRLAVAVTGTPWTDFVDLLPPPDTPLVPPERNCLGEVFLKVARSGEIEMPYLCKDRLEIAQTAQVPLAAFNVPCYDHNDVDRRALTLSLLDCAILFGQSDCAALLATEGVEPSDDGCKLLLKDSALDAEAERRPAATAAAHAVLSKVWKSEIAAKGIAIYQLMKKLSIGKPSPASLVDEVVAMSMDVPKIIQGLDLREEANAWCQSRTSRLGPPQVGRASSQAAASSGRTSLSGGHPHGKESGDEDSQETLQRDQADSEAVDEKATDEFMHLMLAKRASLHDVPPVNNMDGVRMFRLKSFANADHVTDLLFDPNGPLKALHDRVREAGCSVDPAENPVKILLVPCTEEQLLELHQLAADGFELRRDVHILALDEDAALIDAALRRIPRKRRPQLKKVGGSQPDGAGGTVRGLELEEEGVDEDENEHEGPMIERETGFGVRTDSDVGFPSYER